MIRDTVRSYVTDKVVPHVGDWFEEGRIPRELATDLGGLDVLGMHLEGYGCAGASATAYGLGAGSDTTIPTSTADPNRTLTMNTIGGGSAHPNMPPLTLVTWLMKL